GRRASLRAGTKVHRRCSSRGRSSHRLSREITSLPPYAVVADRAQKRRRGAEAAWDVEVDHDLRCGIVNKVRLQAGGPLKAVRSGVGWAPVSEIDLHLI